MRPLKSIALILALGAAGLGPAGGAAAQTCRPVTYATSDLHLEGLTLFDAGGHRQPGRLAKSALGKSFTVTDCDDPVYVMLPVQGVKYLVLKSDLSTPKIDSHCICPATGGRQPNLGVPGGGDLNYCPINQCPAR